MSAPVEEKWLSDIIERVNKINRRQVRPVLFGEYAAFCNGLPGVRLLWPLSSQAAGTNPADISGQGRSATNNGGMVVSLTAQNAPYMALNGSTQYLSRADEAGLDITNGLTMFTWMYFTSIVSGSMMSKSGAAGNRGYQIYNAGSGVLNGQVSVDGTAVTTVTSTAVVLSNGPWYFMALRYTPSTELALWLNATKYINTTSIPASMVNNTQAYTVGARSDASQFISGGMGLSMLLNYTMPDYLINQAYEMGRFLYSN